MARAKVIRLELICVHCGDIFKRTSRELRKLSGQFCSRKCYDADRRWRAKSYHKKDGQHVHRTVMEQTIGRKLRPGEIVHHIDENKHNNNPDNLEITYRSPHVRHHMTGTKQSSEQVKKRVEARRKTLCER